ncbi:MAG: NAD+ synthase [Chloroflexi bacterium]|nr:NAD+ synthase [Chloroflexota bacterium]
MTQQLPDLTRALPPELAFNPERTANAIAAYLKQRLDASGLDAYVLGLSGGVDSALSAALAVRAVGPERLITVKLPSATSSPASQEDAEAVEEALGIPAGQRLLVNVGPIVAGWRTAVGDVEPSPLRIGNVAARSRMIVLWDLAAKYRATVLGTENKTENLLGYFTVYGDAGSAIEPISTLYKSQVWALAEYLGVPQQVIAKSPTADLWAGQTDETELGVRYVEADRVLYWAIDRAEPAGEVAERTGLAPDAVEKVLARYRATAFKRELPYRHGGA